MSSREEDDPCYTRQAYLPTDVSHIREDQSSKTGGTAPEDYFWSDGVLSKELAEEQRKDPKLCDMIKFLESGQLPTDEKRARCLALERPRFELIDGILHLTEAKPP